MINARPVIVQQLPPKVTRGQTDLFFREVAPLLKADRPRMVFDFSNVVQLDSAGIELLLVCMEEALKRNGDLKLAAIPSGPRVVLEMTGVDHLFEIFQDPSDAVESFHRFPVHAFTEESQPWYPSAVSGAERRI